MPVLPNYASERRFHARRRHCHVNPLGSFGSTVHLHASCKVIPRDCKLVGHNITQLLQILEALFQSLDGSCALCC